MIKNKTNKITLTGILIAVGLLLPYVTSHAFGIQGTIILPMHIPVLLLGLICGPVVGLFGGVVIPTLSSIITGMPVAFPMLPIMICELATYGFVSGMVYAKCKKTAYPALISAMLCGRVVYALVYALLLQVNGGVLKALTMPAAFVAGLPGIIIQLILIPSLIGVINKYYRGNNLKDIIMKNFGHIIEEGITCVIIKNKKLIYKGSGRGVKPLLKAYDQDVNIIAGAKVYDKIIGKAAAMILVDSCASEVYGEVMSLPAYDYLKAHNIKASFDRRVDFISNRTGDGMCPLENAVKDISDAKEGIQAIRSTIIELMQVATPLNKEPNLN